MGAWWCFLVFVAERGARYRNPCSNQALSFASFCSCATLPFAAVMLAAKERLAGQTKVQAPQLIHASASNSSHFDNRLLDRIDRSPSAAGASDKLRHIYCSECRGFRHIANRFLH